MIDPLRLQRLKSVRAARLEAHGIVEFARRGDESAAHIPAYRVSVRLHTRVVVHGGKVVPVSEIAAAHGGEAGEDVRGDVPAPRLARDKSY